MDFSGARRRRAFCYSIVSRGEIIFSERLGRTKLCDGLMPKTRTVFHPIRSISAYQTNKLNPLIIYKTEVDFDY